VLRFERPIGLPHQHIAFRQHLAKVGVEIRAMEDRDPAYDLRQVSAELFDDEVVPEPPARIVEILPNDVSTLGDDTYAERDLLARRIPPARLFDVDIETTNPNLVQRVPSTLFYMYGNEHNAAEVHEDDDDIDADFEPDVTRRRRLLLLILICGPIVFGTITGATYGLVESQKRRKDAAVSAAQSSPSSSPILSLPPLGPWQTDDGDEQPSPPPGTPDDISTKPPTLSPTATPPGSSAEDTSQPISESTEAPSVSESESTTNPPTKSPVLNSSTRNPSSAPVMSSPIRTPTGTPTESPVQPVSSPTRNPSASPIWPSTLPPTLQTIVNPTEIPTSFPIVFTNNPTNTIVSPFDPAPSPKPSPNIVVTSSPSISGNIFTSSPTAGGSSILTALPTSTPEVPYPDFRSTVWSDLTFTTQIIARQAGYNEDAWDRPGFNPVEGTVYGDLEEAFDASTLSAIIQLGFTEDTWDCWVNHYWGESWEGLTARGKVAAYEALGWTADMWTSDDPFAVPESEFLQWYELSETQRLAAEDLCYTQELWQGIMLQDWDEVGTMEIDFASLLQRRSSSSWPYVLEDKNSAQHRAFLWLTSNRLYWTYSEDRRIQRWVLAVLALGLSEAPPGPTTIHKLPSWADRHDECNSTESVPIDCDSEGSVQSIKLDFSGLYGTLPFELSLLSNSLSKSSPSLFLSRTLSLCV